MENPIYTWTLKTNKETGSFAQRTDWWSPEEGGLEGGRKGIKKGRLPGVSKISKSCGCHMQHGDCSY